MDNNNPSLFDLLIKAHIGLNRQGPGSIETTKKALSFIKGAESFENIADLGCGTGGQTLILGKLLNGRITALDMLPSFIRVLNKRAAKEGLNDRVKGVIGNMESLPFDKNSFDLIWSEGAIDNIGFKKRLSLWREFLKDDGYIAVSIPSWLTKEHPNDAKQFWEDAGSRLDLIEDNIKIIQNCGYQFIAAFALSEDCWIENYFEPREKAIESLIEEYRNCETVKEYAAINRREAELFLKYKQHYGYVFYIGRNTNNCY